MSRKPSIPPVSHTAHLQRYIEFAPEEIQKKFYNGCCIDSDEWKGDNKECYLFGLKFSEERVFAITILIWQQNNNWTPRYLDVTEQYEKLLEKFNHYHAAYILHRSLTTYKRESNLTEDNIILHKIYDRPELLPKFRHAVTKHHSRDRKFCESYEGEHRGLWDKILHNAIHKMGERFSFLMQQRDERPSSLLFRYTPEPELHICEDSVQRTDEVRREQPRVRKPRGLSDAFSPKRR